MGSVGSINTNKISGDVSFQELMRFQSQKNISTISFNKDVTLLPNNNVPINGKKSDLGKLLTENNISEAIINMYRDRSGNNDLKRLDNLGYKIIAQYKASQNLNSAIPPRDYYYVRKEE